MNTSSHSPPPKYTEVPEIKKRFKIKRKVADGELNAYILSYIGNEAMAERLERQLSERGFPNIQIVYAHDCAATGMRRNRVVYHTRNHSFLSLRHKCAKVWNSTLMVGYQKLLNGKKTGTMNQTKDLAERSHMNHTS